MKHGDVSGLDKLAVAALAALIALLIYCTAVALLKKDYETYLHQQIATGFAQVDEISREVLTTLNQLESKPINSCDEQALHQMRQVVFLSQHIKDIGFLQGDRLICTTGMGQLNTPVHNQNPDFIGKLGAKVWINMPIILTDFEVYAIVVQLEHFNAVIHRDFLDSLITGQVFWKISFANSNGSLTPLAGPLVDAENSTANTDFLLEECSNRIPYCLTVAASNDHFSDQYRLVLLGWQVIAVLAFVFCWLAGGHFLRYYRSTQARITRGLHQGAFYCLYQPIVEISNGKVIGCEVLARYKDAKGDLYPDEFIPLIAEHNNTWPFTRAIIQRTLQDIDACDGLPDGFKININFYPQDIESGAILELLEHPDLKRQQCRFVVEVTENEKLTSRAAGQTLSLLSENGFEIAIDDFGTGYSNLRQIQEYSCHTLKIDRSFISEMEAGSIRATLIPHIVDIARKIDARVVAEGIENNMQNQELISAGVTYGQGYMFGKPMPLDKLLSMIAKG